MKAAVQTKQDLVTRLRQHHTELAELGVARLGLFGSFRHGHVTDESDVDLLAEFVPGQKTFRNYMALTFLLEDLLQRPVEVLTKEGLSPHIGPHILSDVEYVEIGS